MLGSYLSNTAKLQKFKQIDDRGTATYENEMNVNCRKMSLCKTVKKKDGEEIKSKYIYYTDKKIEVDDLIDGMVVIESNEWSGLTSNIIGYKAVV